MRRVLWVNGWPRIGGAERAQLVMFRELRQRYQISALFAEGVTPPLEEATRALGISFSTAPLTQLRQTLEPTLLLRFAKRCAASNWAVHRAINERRIDLVHVTHIYDIPFCALACRANRVPLFWWVEDPEDYNAVNRFITNACRVDGYAGTSTAILRRLTEGGIFAPRRGMVPNPYDQTIFVPSNASRERANAGQTVRVGYAGLFVERKGVLELCSAFVELTRRLGDIPVELWLAGGGGGEYRAAMERVLREGSVWDRVRFVEGLHSPEQMLSFYRDIDVFVMLSKGEGMSIAMLESMASGLPAAILTPWGDDAIEDGVTGVVLRSDGPDAVAAGLEPLVRDTERRLTMGARAAEHLRRNFSGPMVAERIATFYERLWAPGGRAESVEDLDPQPLRGQPPTF
ncbi:MAG TPA: glycosyltransferase family 4 protein [Polyangiaceae bacterium]